MRSANFLLCSLVLLSLPAAAEDRVVLHDTTVVLDATLVVGADATATVSVAGSTDLDESKPIGKADMRLALERHAGKEVVRVELAQASTDDHGNVIVSFRVPEIEAGTYELVAHTRSAYGEDTVRRPESVTNSVVVHLRTDRPVYRAGQTLRWRVTSISAADAHPRKDAPVELAIADPRGTKIWRGKVTTDETGMVSGALPLADDLILGGYVLTATSGGTSASETVLVREFVPPPFSVEIQVTTPTPVAAGKTVEGDVVASYTYGEPVAGSVELAGGDKAKKGALDRSGRWHFSVTAPEGGEAVPLSATVTDGAKRSRTVSLDVPLRSDRLEMALIPETRQFDTGDEVGVTVITTDGHGNFVPARVILAAAGSSRRQGGKSLGVTRFQVKATSSYMDLRATAMTDDGRTATEETYAYRDYDGGAIHVDDVVVAPGQAIRAHATWKGARGPVIATLLRHGAPVAESLATVDKDGNVAATLTAPDGVFGLATVRLADAGFDPKTGVMAGTAGQAAVYLRPTVLAVTIDGETRHSPGETARLDVKVRDAEGRPVAGAGLAASVVDERVLALGEPRPDLVEVLRALDVDHAEAAGIAFAELLSRDDALSRLALRAIVESLPPDPEVPFIASDAAARIRSELLRLQKAEPAVYQVVLIDPQPIGKRVGTAWEFASELHELLARANWKAEDRLTPWREPTTWAYARKLLPDWTFDEVAQQVADERLDRLLERLRRVGKPAHKALHEHRTDGLRALVQRGKVAAYLGVDPWGTPIQVVRDNDGAEYVNIVSAGPDTLIGTKDDLERADVFLESHTGLGTIGTGAGGGGYGEGSGMGFGSGRVAGAPSVMIGGPAVALRQRFDETVLWVTGVRTDAAGGALLEVPLADSITGWQVQVEATSPRGGIGAAKAHLETFLPLHVDTDVPPTLTRGDRYSIAVVVANHSGRERSLTVQAAASGPLALAGEGRRVIAIASGATRAVSFPVEARAAGEGELRLSLSDEAGGAVDAMKRTVKIDPPGSLVREIRSGELAEHGAKLSIAVPPNALAANARVRLFRGTSDQALDGLEDLLQAPNGCFEQTSSTTHPNLLVLDLLRDRAGAEAIRQRALDYVARGYQRLVSYEVPGGGYSWFGDAPANQVLTAYGLLEFTDMARVYPVDPDVIARTRKWLLSKQRSDGSWKPDDNWLHDWSAVQGKVSTTAYIAWALAQAGYKGKALGSALEFLRKHQDALGKDPYLLGLWAGAEASAGGKPSVPLGLLAKYESRDDGKLRYRSGGRTLFYSTGTGADVQVTALTAGALRQAGRRGDAQQALSWVWEARSDGGWDSTQGVMMALRAAAALSERQPARQGKIPVLIDGKPAGSIDLDGDDVPTLELKALAAGEHVVTLKDTPAGLLYDLRLTYRESTDPQPVDKGIQVELKPTDNVMAIGSRIGMTLRLRNSSKEAIAMPTVVVPVPPGFKASTSSLKGLEQSRVISKFEDYGSEIHLYLEQLPEGNEQTLRFDWDVVSDCRVLQRPAVAYAYYSPSTRGSSGVFTLTGYSQE